MTDGALPELTRGRLLGGAAAALGTGGLLAACGSAAARDKTRVGILSAVTGEQTGLLARLDERKTVRRGAIELHSGTLFGKPAAVTVAGIGGVSAAAAAGLLVGELGATRLVFIGTAAAFDESVSVGDVLVGFRAYQLDVDYSPFRPPLVQPFVGAGVPTDPALRGHATRAARDFLERDLAKAVSAGTLRSQAIERPKVVIGTIVSTSTLNANTCKHRLLELVPVPGCLENEGGAMTQVGKQLDVPVVVVRAISNRVGADGLKTYDRFVGSGTAGAYTVGILRRLFARI
jgi:adenosylhomocysteine nucleosidase